MSDQQLITGFSLILATNLIRYGVADLDKTISGYSYCIAMSLSLLSCVTHLSAMAVLRGHYDSNRRLRDTKTFLMIAAIALLLPQFVTCQRVGTSLTLRCALDDLEGDTGLHWDPDDIYVQTFFFATLAMVGILACGYLQRILELYSPRFRESPEAWVAEACASIFSWPSQADINAFNAAAHADQLARERLLLVGLNGLREYFVLVSVIEGEMRGSFFGEIVWFLFYSTFALCQICFFIVWGSGSDWKAPISFTPQFGQILSLGMLILPLLSAIDGYRSESAYIAIYIQQYDLRIPGHRAGIS